MAGEKKYLAVMTMGIKTDTLDRTGRVLMELPVPDMPQEEIASIVRAFTGNIEQRPPSYSAVKFEGQRAYKLARKGIEADLGKRMVTIHSIEVVSVSMPDITFEVTCSGGKYLRALASDIG
jgi:tRNA pseudouridine55 synthase